MPDDEVADQSAAPAVDASATDLAASSNGDDLDLGYQVALSAFSGPLDLLLHLVRKSEVDIADISIVDIADQFLEAVSSWEDADLEVAGDFILMAATLLEIKARSIAPLPEAEDEEAEEDDWIDPRADLVRQLLAFRKTKDAVQWLEDLEDERVRLHHRRFVEQVPEDPSEADAIDLDNADPYALFKTWEKILASIAGHRQRTVVYDDIPIDERVKKIEAAMAAAREAQLAWLLAQEDKPISRVGVVVASLEAMRKRVMEAIQHEQYGPIYLHYLEDERRAWTALEPEVDGSNDGVRKRRRRPPLFTWRPPEGGDAEIEDQSTPEDEESDLVVETDEQRFVRELNETCAVDSLLERMRHLDQHLDQRLREEGLVSADNSAVDVDHSAPGEQAETVEAAAEPGVDR